MTLQQALKHGIAKLSEAGIDNSKFDAKILLLHVLNKGHTFIYTNPDYEMQEAVLMRYEAVIEKRCAHYPLQYITETQEFMGITFHVNQAVLIPRQDTEILVETILGIIKKENKQSVLDICTGSGCIIISLANLHPLTKAVGSDISEKALAVARRNGTEINPLVSFIQGDLFEHITEGFDVIVSNPPYIPTKDIEELMIEVKEFEPHLALDGESDGLAFYRRIVNESTSYLNQDGYLFFEIGYNQGQEVSDLLAAGGYRDIHVVKDLAGLDRVVYGKK